MRSNREIRKPKKEKLETTPNLSKPSSIPHRIKDTEIVKNRASRLNKNRLSVSLLGGILLFYAPLAFSSAVLIGMRVGSAAILAQRLTDCVLVPRHLLASVERSLKLNMMLFNSMERVVGPNAALSVFLGRHFSFEILSEG